MHKKQYDQYPAISTLFVLNNAYNFNAYLFSLQVVIYYLKERYHLDLWEYSMTPVQCN